MKLVIKECKQYLAYGLKKSNEVKEYSEAVCVSNNIFGRFLSDNIERDNKVIVIVKELYDAHKFMSKDIF